MLIGTCRRARRSERREWRKSRQGTRNKRGLVIQIPLTNSPGSFRHSRRFFTSSKVNSRLIASITSTLPFGATFTFLPCRSSKSIELVVDLPESRSSAHLRDDLQADRIESKRSVRLADGPPRNERLPENGISIRSNRCEFRGSQITCRVGACHASKEFQEGGTRTSRDANLPIFRPVAFGRARKRQLCPPGP